METGATRSPGVAFHHRDLEPELRGANRSYVSARAASDDGEIELVRQDVLAFSKGLRPARDVPCALRKGRYHEVEINGT